MGKKRRMLERLVELEERHREIEELMANPDVATDMPRMISLGREYSSLGAVISVYREYRKVSAQLEETKPLLQETADPEMASLVKEEIGVLEQRQATLSDDLQIALLPKNPNDERDVFVEIRAAAGGEEAALFATELYRMYTRYAQTRAWGIELVDANETGIGGFKEVIFEVKGKGAYSCLKYESGGHRVQRVPVTESSGRIHTSTVTVAVMPEAEDVEVGIEEKDLRVDVFHAGGAGGQNVNKVATAIRITHIPTGIVATCQDERSQLRNKQKAMAVLKARLLDKALNEQQEALTADRRSKVGSGERAEKVRTYNYPQDRITDHRINLTLHNLQTVLDGGLDALIQPLMTEDRNQKLEDASIS